MNANKISNPPPPQWELEWRVVAIAAKDSDVDPSTITPDSRMIEDLGIDSLEIVELMMELEEEFEVTLPDEAAPQVFWKGPLTLRMLATFVRERWGTGTPERADWKSPRAALPAAEELPFTQLGGRLRGTEWQEGQAYESMGRNREGFEQFRRRTDGIRCVAIPAAETWIGNDGADASLDQRPAHRVRIDAFLIDAEPVSNLAYCRFLNSVGNLPNGVLADWCGVSANDKRDCHFPLRHGRGGWKPIPKTERQPMILVSWYGANAYSLWANQLDWRGYDQDTLMTTRLPTEAQWEYAARGPEINCNSSVGAVAIALRVGRHAIGYVYEADTLPSARVSERLGMSPFGLHHMGGNVWQWCRDWYAPDFYDQSEACGLNPVNTQTTGIRSERGGSWVGPAKLTAPSYRRGRPPMVRGRCLGFRCIS